LSRLLLKTLRKLVMLVAKANNKLPAILEIELQRMQGKGTGDSVEVEAKTALEFITRYGITEPVVLDISAFINSSAIVGSNVVISNYVTINRGANIGHDVEIGEFTHIAPSSCILGSVKIGKKVTIGANSKILPKLNIGDGAFIGAGSVVTRDAIPDQIMYGSLAKK
jgi:acetyltransferase-like isoleucine patch superfamily enzyme